MNVLAFDTATPATVVGAWRTGTDPVQARDDPEPGARPDHATRLLGLVDQALASAGLDRGGLERLGVGTGPGSFTGLRIGLATARGLAQGLDLGRLAPVGTLDALAAGARAKAAGRPVLAALDAHRGEAYAAAFAGDRALAAPAALGPEALTALAAGLPAPPLAVGDGAVRFRSALQAAGAAIPADASPLHRLDGRLLCRLAAAAETADRDAVLPHYVRSPDAKPR